MLAHVVDTILLQSKINHKPAFKTNKRIPDWITIDEHCRHTARVIVSAMKLIGEKKQNRKIVYSSKEKIEFHSKTKCLVFLYKGKRLLILSFCLNYTIRFRWTSVSRVKI